MHPDLPKTVAERLHADPGLPRPNPTISYWQKDHPLNLHNIASDTLPPERDVVIIGSGITGCSVARWLLAEGPESLSVTVLEARGLCSGATGRNGGHIKCNAFIDYCGYIKNLGLDHKMAEEIVRFALSHYESIRTSAEELGALEIGEVRSVTAVTVLMDPQKMSDFKEMHAAFEKALPDLKGMYRFCDADEVKKEFKIGNALGAVLGPAGAAWPYRMVTAIFRSLLEQHRSRFAVETFTPALAISRDNGGSHPYRITTPRGSILARHVVHCTEGHVAHLLPQLRGILWPRRGQMTVQLPGDYLQQFEGEYSWAFHFCNSFDYITQNVRSKEIFIGGGEVVPEEENFEIVGNASDEGQSTLAIAHLGGALPAVFGEQLLNGKAPQIKAAWSGIMCASLDKLPIVGKLPSEALPDRPAGSPEAAEWISAGYGGYGMVQAWLSGKAVAHSIVHGSKPDWLPEPYDITPARFRRLQEILESTIASNTFKALL